MNVYRVIIFITNDKIHVLEAINKDKIKKIGFHGNEFFFHENATDIEVFYEELTDHYNVNDLSELNIHINVIDCNANKQTILAFLKKSSSCTHVSLNKAEDVIPVILTQKELHKDVDNICVFLGDNKYTYSVSDNYYSLQEYSDSDKQICLSFEDFNSLLFWSRCKCSDLNKELKLKSEIIKEKDSLILKKENEISKLKKELQSLTQTITPINQELKILQSYKKNRELIDHRVVVRAKSLPYKGSYVNYSVIIAEEVKDGAIVSNGDEIGWLKETRRKKLKTAWRVYATRSGKIAWLQPDDEFIKTYNVRKRSSYSGDYTEEDFPAVAVIGDEDDNTDEMRKWFEKFFK